MQWVFSDGGRAAAGYKGKVSDCCVRAFAIASGASYDHVASLVLAHGMKERPSQRAGLNARSDPEEGVWMSTARKVARQLGAEWHPTMLIGSGCKVHLRGGELPPGRLVARVSRHFVAVIDGVMFDLEDPSRDGTRCVYGYWDFPLTLAAPQA